MQHHALWLSAIHGALSIYHRALCCRIHLSLLTTMICFSKMWWPSTAFMENCGSYLWRNVLFAKLDARVMLISRHLHVTYRTTCQLLHHVSDELPHRVLYLHSGLHKRAIATDTWNLSFA